MFLTSENALPVSRAVRAVCDKCRSKDIVGLRFKCSNCKVCTQSLTLRCWLCVGSIAFSF
jgi:hypothetical protein